jgi:hypothetical protein
MVVLTPHFALIAGFFLITASSVECAAVPGRHQRNSLSSKQAAGNSPPVLSLPARGTKKHSSGKASKAKKHRKQASLLIEQSRRITQLIPYFQQGRAEIDPLFPIEFSDNRGGSYFVSNVPPSQQHQQLMAVKPSNFGRAKRALNIMDNGVPGTVDIMVNINHSHES